MKKQHLPSAIPILAAIILAVISFYFFSNNATTKTRDLFHLPSQTEKTQTLPLSKYAVPMLLEADFTPSAITLADSLDLGIAPQARQFFFSDSFARDKRISGTITLPPAPGTYPVLLLLRGWADEEIYYSGYGTKNAAAYFAQNGYITVAPDFLGYADSDPYADSPIEARFQTYTAAITLYSSLGNLNTALSGAGLNYSINPEKVGVWGHSNGGQISLALLAVTGDPIPTTLWAPVTIPFPDNIVHYAADQDDRGALIRNLVHDFKSSYDESVFTPTNYLDRITAPMLLHQGTADDAVPVEWNDDFSKKMDSLGKDVIYHVYPGVDHNMRPSWGTVIRRDVEFFNAYLQ